ncbi:MAG TPA: hypothetical protein VF610_13475 [Segetibacter sp.]|jgi:hypothetical protein
MLPENLSQKIECIIINSRHHEESFLIDTKTAAKKIMELLEAELGIFLPTTQTLLN